MPQALRTARHSRPTAACMCSVPARKVARALPQAHILEHRTRARAHSCMGVARTGSNSSPRDGPAKAPKVTGV